MRYTIEMDIDLPRDRVLELFLDRSNTQKWQPGLVRSTPLRGQPGEVGSQDRQVHRQGKREQELIETIKVMNPPQQVSATYEGGSVWNLVENHFHEEAEARTRWVLHSEFRSSNPFMKLMTVLVPGMFRRQTRNFMVQFKTFAESAG